MTTEALRLTDPTSGSVPSWLARIGLRMIHDERDLPFLSLIAQTSLVLFPFAIYLFMPGNFSWWLGAIYLAVAFLGFVDRCILMLHNTSHRPLFKGGFRWLNGYAPRVLSPFFGETPDTYFCHHLGMHHPENNLKDDLSSTMRFQRDSLPDFLRYFGRFFFLGMIELPIYLWKKGRKRLALRALGGELIAYAAYGALLWLNWRAALVVFVIPFLMVRFLMMCGNWGQHAFIDAARPENPYVNSITCINTRYNRRCFNDGYHIGHHVKASRHWTEMPGDFERNIARYHAEGAVVFEGIDFFQVWALLMTRNYRALAKHYVSLDGSPKDEAKIIEHLKTRTRAIAV